MQANIGSDSPEVLPKFLFELSDVVYMDEYQMPWHLHDGIELILCVSGCTVLETHHDAYPVIPGTLIVMNSRVPHRIRITAPPYRRLLIHFDPTPMQGDLYDSLSMPIQLYLSANEYESFLSSFGVLSKMIQRPPYTDGAVLRKLTELVTYTLGLRHRHVSREIRKLHVGRFEHFVRPVVDMLHRNRFSLSVKEIAATMGYSESHLRRVFRETTGISITNYVRTFRLQEAKRLLLTRGHYLSVAEIGRRLEFSSTAYFSEYFKRHTGLSPTDFRHVYVERSVPVIMPERTINFSVPDLTSCPGSVGYLGCLRKRADSSGSHHPSRPSPPNFPPSY